MSAMFANSISNFANSVTGAIREAAERTGAGFEYLMKTAMRESSLDPQAKADTSSATGLFQFIDQTWLATLKEQGAGLGYGAEADKISRLSGGRYAVTDPADRKQIMDLRFDPKANAVMAGAFTQRNAQVLNDALGRQPTDGELYIAHFLGAGGAAKFISSAQSTPSTNAAALFPDAAEANRSIFFDKSGAARSMADVYKVLVRKHDAADVGVASALSSKMRAQAIASRPAASEADTAPLPTGPLFQTMFAAGARGPVSPTVASLWGGGQGAFPVDLGARAPMRGVEMSSQRRMDVARPGAIGAPLDLAQFLKPAARGR